MKLIVLVLLGASAGAGRAADAAVEKNTGRRLTFEERRSALDAELEELGTPGRRLTFDDVDAVVKESARRRLATVQIDLVIEMDTCGERGFTSNDECLASFVAAIEKAARNGLLAERLQYWADFYEIPLWNITLGIGNVSLPFNYSWVFAPTSKPTMVPTPVRPSPKPVGAPSPAPVAKPTPAPVSAPTRQPTSKDKKKKDGIGAGAIAGIVIACLVALCCCLAVLYMMCRKEEEEEERKDTWEMADEAPPPEPIISGDTETVITAGTGATEDTGNTEGSGPAIAVTEKTAIAVEAEPPEADAILQKLTEQAEL